MKKEMKRIVSALLIAMLLLSGCVGPTSTEQNGTHVNEQTGAEVAPETSAGTESAESGAFSLSDIPTYSGQPYVAVNGNIPFFEESELSATAFETYSELDALGRCGVAYACIGQELMPTEERGSIGQVKPSGWHTVKYDNVDGKYLYNRCHLIGYQLTGENANEQNLITGTRSMNVDGMLPFENLVADYVQETGNHVLYRVTPVFDGDNLVASGVLMEAESVEDKGEGVLYNVYVYNIQSGIDIDYQTGESALSTTPDSEANESEPGTEEEGATEQAEYILNTNTRKFHKPSCSSASDIAADNKESYVGSRAELIEDGYAPCGRCKP